MSPSTKTSTCYFSCWNQTSKETFFSASMCIHIFLTSNICIGYGYVNKDLRANIHCLRLTAASTHINIITLNTCVSSFPHNLKRSTSLVFYCHTIITCHVQDVAPNSAYNIDSANWSSVDMLRSTVISIIFVHYKQSSWQTAASLNKHKINSFPKNWCLILEVTVLSV